MSSRQTPTGTKLSTRLLGWYSIIYLVLIAVLAIVIDTTARRTLIGDIEDNLATAAQLARLSLPEDDARYQTWAADVFDAGGFRVTLIDTDGVVLADSHSDPATMENHGDREEVQEALGGEIGVANRVSASTGFDQRYVAPPPVDGLMVRTSIATRVINEDLSALRTAIVVSAAVLGVLGVVVVGMLARRLARPIAQLQRQATSVAEGDYDVEPARSSVVELDRLGVAIQTLAMRFRSRLSDAEEAANTLEVVLGALPQGTILIGDDEKILYANPAAHSILGDIPTELGGLSPHQFQTSVRQALASREPAQRELEHGSPVRRLRGVATPFVDDGRVLLMIIDTTERDRIDSIRRDFVANASHELKTPVATIIASSEAMRIAQSRGDQSVDSFADRIESSARQLDDLVSDLLDLSRLERETPEVSPVRVDLLVSDEVERVRSIADERGISLSLEVSAVTAVASHRDIAIAVRNLLDNAIRYTSGDGSIKVMVDSDEKHVRISVADTGEGIPTRDLERVFERFYRVDSARARSTGGTGLGLSIVKHVAESHKGSVSVDSELGVGSRFVINLPMGEESADN